MHEGEVYVGVRIEYSIRCRGFHGRIKSVGSHLRGPVWVPVKRVVNHTRFGSYLSTRKSYATRSRKRIHHVHLHGERTRHGMNPVHVSVNSSEGQNQTQCPCLRWVTTRVASNWRCTCHSV